MDLSLHKILFKKLKRKNPLRIKGKRVAQFNFINDVRTHANTYTQDNNSIKKILSFTSIKFYALNYNENESL
jgi:hypothetical protein